MVNEGIEQSTTTQNVTYTKLPDGRNSYTLREIPGLWTRLVAFDREKGEYIENKDGTITFITDKVIDIKSHIEVKPNGSEEFSYEFSENKNGNRNTRAEIIETKNVEGRNLERREAGQKVANDIYSWNRRDPVFDKAMVNISQ